MLALADIFGEVEVLVGKGVGELVRERHFLLFGVHIGRAVAIFEDE